MPTCSDMNRILSEIRGWFHTNDLDGLYNVLMEAGNMKCSDLAGVVEYIRSEQGVYAMQFQRQKRMLELSVSKDKERSE